MAGSFEDHHVGSVRAFASDSKQQRLRSEFVNRHFQDGQIIHGKYKVLRMIGSGPNGFVVAARHIGFDDVVALKSLWPKLARHTETATRFTSEARANFRLRSEHIVRVLDVDMFHDVPFIAMELLEGFDLRNVLRRERTLEVRPAVDCLLQACAALSAVHSAGAVHGNIKPENLFLIGSGDHLKVLDFGLSLAAPVAASASMSPEQARGSSELDARSDLWSLGCVLFELLTGASFARNGSVQSSYDGKAPPLATLPATISQALSEVIMRCLREDPAERFSDVAELACALSPFGSDHFSGYADRCRASLNDEGPDRRSTPRALPPVRHRGTPAAISGSDDSAPLGASCNEPAVRQMSAAQLLTELPNTGYNARAATSRVSTLLATRATTPVTPRRATVLFGVGSNANEPSTNAPVGHELDAPPPRRHTNQPLFWSGALAFSLICLLALTILFLRRHERSPSLTHSPRTEHALPTDLNESTAAKAMPKVEPQVAAPHAHATMSASRARPHSNRDVRPHQAPDALYTSSNGPSSPNQISRDPEVGF